MPLYKRKDIPRLLAEIEKKGSPSQVYLIWGERYLCRNAAQEIIDRLLPEEKRHSTSLLHIDGDQEDFSKTLSLLKTFSLFSGPQIIWITDSKLFLSKGVAKNFWEKAGVLAWAKMGANLIIHSGDIRLFEKILRADLMELRQALGDDSPANLAQDATVV